MVGSLVNFTAVRDIAPFLLRAKLFSDFHSEPVPDQIYLWGRAGLPFQTFFALPVRNATNLLSYLAPPFIALINPHLGPNVGALTFDTNAWSLTWRGLAHASPFLEAVTNSSPQFILGGFAPYVKRTNNMPSELVDYILAGTNFVYFDWEITGQNLLHWRYLDDVYRIVFDAHGPRLTDTASFNWFSSNATNLSHSVTEVRLVSSNRLTFARKSTIGLTGLELDLLANWIELPEFPLGLATIMATNAAPVLKPKHSPTPSPGP